MNTVSLAGTRAPSVHPAPAPHPIAEPIPVARRRARERPAARAFASAIVLAAVLAPAAAQEDPAAQHVSFTLMVQSVPGDVVPNRELVAAMLSEPELPAALRKALGDSFRGVAAPWVEWHEPHGSGTFQFQCGAEVKAAAFDDTVRDRVTDAMVAHVCTRLDALLYVQPRELWQVRANELRERLVKLQGDRAALQAQVDAAGALFATATERRQWIEAQAIETRLDLATVERAQEHLAKLCEEHVARRNATRRELEKAQLERGEVEQRAADAGARVAVIAQATPPDPKQVEAVRAELHKVELELRVAGLRVEQCQESVADQQRTLTVILEQLPTNTLALQRARSRLEALEAERLEREKQLADAMDRRARTAELEAALDRSGIDLAVTKGVLAELEGKLARLQPVRYQLLRRRAD